jgi:hypothetical protein
MVYPAVPGHPLRVALCSDGLKTRWSLDHRHRGLLGHDPATIAAVLWRDFARGRDDATAAIVQARAPVVPP